MCHHQVLMCLVVGVYPLMLAVPFLLLNLIPHVFFLASALSMLATVLEVAALSMAFRWIGQQS